MSAQELVHMVMSSDSVHKLVLRQSANTKLRARGTRSTSSSFALHVFDLQQHQLSFLELLKGKNEVSM